jgi:hypothetical protein
VLRTPASFSICEEQDSIREPVVAPSARHTPVDDGSVQQRDDSDRGVCSPALALGAFDLDLDLRSDLFRERETLVKQRAGRTTIQAFEPEPEATPDDTKVAGPSTSGTSSGAPPAYKQVVSPEEQEEHDRRVTQPRRACGVAYPGGVSLNALEDWRPLKEEPGALFLVVVAGGPTTAAATHTCRGGRRCRRTATQTRSS